MQPLFRLTVALAVLTLLAIALLAACPLLLEGHQFDLRCVRAKFTTPAEQFSLATEAAKAGKPVFGALYDSRENQMMSAYVPPRASLAHVILYAVNFGKPIAAKEDFLPAPPAPMAFEFIDEVQATPLTLTQFRHCRKHWLWVLIPLNLLFVSAAWFARGRVSHGEVAPVLGG
jgi:hypothetical protein